MVNPPEPVSAAVTVRVPLFVSVTPVTVTLGIEKVPVSPWLLVSKVYIPAPAVNVPLLVMPLRMLTASPPELFQVAFVLTVTKPPNCNAALVAEIVRLPLVPLPMVVVPVTVRA